MISVEIIGTGVYAPGAPIDNQELKQITGLDFDHEKLEGKLGIYQRHIARLRKLDETTADFATQAALNAIKNAGISEDEIGLFIVGTDTPEFVTPATAILVQGRIQKKETWASSFDVAASCASFAIAFNNAVSLMHADDTIQYAVVIGVYNMPAFLRKDDAFGYTIFADGAGAVVLKRTKYSKSAFLASQLLTDGTQWDYIGIYSGGSRHQITKERIDANLYGLQNLQPLPGDRNVRLWPMVVQKLAEKANVKISEIDHFIFTQINKSVIVKVMNELNISIEKTTFVMDKYGYTGSGCIPMAFHDSVSNGKIKKGDKVMFVASGAGLAVGSNLFIY